MTGLIKSEWDDNKTFFVLQLILKFSLKEKKPTIVNLPIVYPRCFNIPNQSLLPEHFPNNLIIQK